MLKDREEGGEVGKWRDKGGCPGPTRGAKASLPQLRLVNRQCFQASACTKGSPEKFLLPLRLMSDTRHGVVPVCYSLATAPVFVESNGSRVRSENWSPKSTTRWWFRENLFNRLNANKSERDGRTDRQTELLLVAYPPCYAVLSYADARMHDKNRKSCYRSELVKS